MRTTRLLRGARLAAAAAVLFAAVVAITDAQASGALCAGTAGGGEWRQYSHDLDNTRHQPAEDEIGATRAGALTQRWTFSAAAQGGSGSFNHDPIIADGCMYLASTTGWVFALNADTGQVVWQHQLANGVNSSPAVQGGKVYLHVNRSDGPYLEVLNQATGESLWTKELDPQAPGSAPVGTELLSSPKLFGHYVFSGISGAGAEAGTTFTNNPQKRLHFRGIYTVIDTETHEIVVKDHTISDEDFAHGFSGGGIWSSAAIDEVGNYAYVGSGNPFNAHEHDNTNSILKIDLDPARTTYGQIVAHYHGTNDTYVDGLTFKPTCDAYTDVFTCETSDFDFGSSPQLFTATDGTPVVGAHQKSGVYHVAKRADMSRLWKQTVGGPFGWFGGEGTASFDGESIVVPGNIPGLLSSLRRDTGAQNWVAPIADGIHFTSVTTANGVAYAVDTRGMLDIWDTATGQQIAAKPMGVETNSPTTTGFSTGFSVSVARHTVYVPYGGSVVAYQ